MWALARDALLLVFVRLLKGNMPNGTSFKLAGSPSKSDRTQRYAWTDSKGEEQVISKGCATSEETPRIKVTPAHEFTIPRTSHHRFSVQLR